MKPAQLQPLVKTYQTLSTLLYNTALAIQTTDYTIAADWANLIEKVKTTAAVFSTYAEKEEAVLSPLLHQYEPALIAILRDDRFFCNQYLIDLATLFSTMQAATDKHKSRLFSHKLLYRLNEFVATTLQQINEHESMINTVLWRYCSGKELAQMEVSLAVQTPVALYKKDTSFADKVISNVMPVKVVRKRSKVYTHEVETAMAIAI